MWYWFVIVSRNQTELQYGLLLEPPGGNSSSLSPAYMVNEISHCFSLFLQVVRCACSLARANAGSSMAARMAMMAITTNSSMSVKPSDTRKPDAMGAGLGLRVVGVLPIKLLSLYGSSLTRIQLLRILKNVAESSAGVKVAGLV